MTELSTQTSGASDDPKKMRAGYFENIFETIKHIQSAIASEGKRPKDVRLHLDHHAADFRPASGGFCGKRNADDLPPALCRALLHLSALFHRGQNRYHQSSDSATNPPRV